MSATDMPQDRDHAEMYQFLVLLAILARFA
jgi:hypothetical protein